MMERELMELFEAVKKAADAAVADGESSPEEDRCIDALNQLEKFPVNYQILVSTQVGKSLRHLTKHPRKKIQALASHLIDMWKNVIVEERMKNKNGSSDTKNSVKSESVGTEASDGNGKRVQRVNSMKVDKVSKIEKNPEASDGNGKRVERVNSMKVDKVSKIEKNDHSSTKTIKTKITEQKTTRECIKVEKVTKEEKQNFDVRKPAPLPKLGSVIYCKDALRDKIRELLSEALLKVYNEIDEDLRGEADACDPYRVAVSLESAMFDKWGKSNSAHKFKYRSIMFNIKDAQNPDFRRKVLLGYVKPVRVLEMTPEEMASNERQMQNGKIREKALLDCERAGPPKATTDQFKCGRCGKKQCTYYQMQTRSADEPMTTFVTCVNCDNHWKFC